MTLVGKTTQQFRFLAPIGEGGYGHVWVGQDEKLDRRVALKVLRREQRIKPQAKARLLREARILSQLDHPHICRIYDFIEGADRDFLVLELIEGRSLKEAIREGLDEAARMRVAEQIADALVAAHGQGIIHRDLKPGNVMITPEGDVKVLDFGIARLLDDDEERPPLTDFEEAADDKTTADFTIDPDLLGPRTESGDILGTPAYMSPEQIKNEPTTAASDMYSFGLILQELFTGEPAYDTSLPKALLLVKVALAETRPASGLDGELQALVERLKSAEPAARPAAVDTAERLRWIRDQPRRRRRRWLIGGVMVGLALLAGVMAFLTVRIDAERDRANREADTAREVQSFLVDLFEQSSPQDPRGREMTAEQLLERGAARIENELADRPRVQATIMDTIGTVEMSLGLHPQAEPLLERALEIRLRELGGEHLEVAESLTSLGILRRWQEDYTDAEVAHRQALDIRRQLLDPDDPLIALSLGELGVVHWFQGRFGEAQTVLEEALRILEGRFGTQDERLIDVLHRLSYVYLTLGRYAQAEKALDRVLALRRAHRDPFDPDTAYTLQGLGTLYRQLGRYDQAEEVVRQSLEIRESTFDPSHGLVAWSLFELGHVLFEVARYDEAEAVYRRALEIEDATDGARASSLSGLASTLSALGRWDEAESLHREAIEITTQVMPGHSMVADMRLRLGEHLATRGKDAEAQHQLQQALAQLDQITLGHPEAARVLNRLGDLERSRGALETAASHYRRALEVGQQNGYVHADVARSYCGLAAVYEGLGRAAEARALRQRGLARWQEMGLAKHPQAIACQRR